MTFEEAKDTIARVNGKESWFMWGYEFSEPYGREIPLKYLEKAAELYARSKWEEAIKEYEKLNNTVSPTIPEFKP
jgi:hypothetical protein